VADYLGGFGSPLRGAILYAPRNLGDTSIYVGNPAGAAMAGAQLELSTAPSARTRSTRPASAATSCRRAGRGERDARRHRHRADAPGALVEQSLRLAAQQLRAGDRRAALAT
jgi:hypothetical protein